MSDAVAADGIRTLLKRRPRNNKGVIVHVTESNKLVIDIHIVVSYGLNISAIVKSITHKVRYTVEDVTGLEVSKINIFVDRVAE